MKSKKARKKLKAPRAFTFVLFLMIVFLGLHSCGTYFDAEIAGYVIDSESSSGVNGAVIRMYLTEEDITQEEEAEDGSVFYIVETASMSSQGNDGYFSHKIMWQNVFGEFGSEGDSGEVWLKITHEDYTETTSWVSGILSDTINVVPNILIERATFSTPQLRGRVLNVSGDGVNGVRLVLDLASTTEEEEDYITTTGFSNGEPGYYIFQNVTWRDEQPDSDAADTETAAVVIDDPDYQGSGSLSVTLTSGQDSEAPADIVATRKPRTQFSTNVSGRCIRRITTVNDTVDIPAQGVEIKLYYVDDNGPHTLYDQTDANGSFGMLVQWTDSDPEDDTDPTIPEGEDVVFIELVYDPDGLSSYTFTSDITGATVGTIEEDEFRLKSWLNPNYLPDAIDDT